MPSDILIIPNRNSTTAAPVMLFSGSQGNSIRLEVLTSGSLAFLGKSGSLFSISDNFSGSLMAVGDISGLPILEVFSDDRVVMGRFNSNALVVTGSNVGIGKSNPNPAARLDVSGSVFISGSTSITGSLTVSVPSGTAATFSTPGGGFVSFTNGLIDSNSSQFGFKAGVGSAAYIGANNSQHLTINTAGNVGIGKTTPSVSLDVNGNTFITGALTATNTGTANTLQGNNGFYTTRFASSAGGDSYVWVGSRVSVPVIQGNNAAFSSALPLALNAEGGNVGVGTTTPSTKFDVNGNTSITGSLSVRASAAGIILDTGAAADGRIEFKYNGTREGLISVDSNKLNIQGDTGTDVVMFTTGNTNQLVVSSSGNVGIGTGAPATKLQVNGTFASNGLWTDPSTVSFWGGYPSAYGVMTWDTGYARIYATSPNRLDLGAGGSSAYLTISAAGNVGIRKTAPSVVLDVSGSVLISGSFRVADAATNTLVISGSNMGIGKVPSAEAYVGAGIRAKLDVNGDTVISGSLTIQPGVGSNGIYTNGPFGVTFMHNGSSRGSIVAVQSQGMSVTSVESGQPLTLGAGNTAKVYIFDSGNVSINKSTSNARLDVNGSTIITGSLTVTGSIFDFRGDVRDIPQNLQTAGYTLVAEDNGKHIFTTASITVPASVFVTGDVVTVINSGSATLSITQGSSVLLRQAGTTNTGSRTLASYGIASITCVASNTFYVTGTGLV